MTVLGQDRRFILGGNLSPLEKERLQAKTKARVKQAIHLRERILRKQAWLNASKPLPKIGVFLRAWWWILKQLRRLQQPFVGIA